MSVLIRGMEMPTNCLDCDFDDVYGDCGLRDKRPWACEYSLKARPEWCPLIELPPHGRLIEASEVKDWVENWFEMHRYYHPYSKSTNIPAEELYDLLERVQTIIEAEEVQNG